MLGVELGQGMLSFGLLCFWRKLLNGMFWNWSDLAEGGKAIHFGVFLKGMRLYSRKALSLSLSCTWYRGVALLVWKFGAWCKLCLWAFGIWTFWAFGPAPAQTGVLVGPGYMVSSRGLDPVEDENPLLESVSHAGMCASLGSSIWDIMIQCSTEHGFWIAT